MREFIELMKTNVPSEARIMLCQFRGDPGDDIKGKWRAYVLNDYDMIDQHANVYLCVSAMQRNGRNEFRRRKENFAGGLLLMIDDLGDGAGSKFPLRIIDAAPPTALIETSPGNFQAVYFFRELVTDRDKFERLIRAFIARQFLGRDTGMAGVNRVFRPPCGVNGKPKYEKWKVRCQDWTPTRTYTVEELALAFDLDLRPGPKRLKRVTLDNRQENIDHFERVFAELEVAGFLKAQDFDLGGWLDVRCPWTDDHTGGIDNGAAIALPSVENGWYGGFRCHHGACERRGWRELTQWLTDEQEEVLEYINKNAKGML